MLISNNYAIVNKLNKYVHNQSFTEKCAVMFTWDFENIRWIYVPCGEKILDKFSVLCVRHKIASVNSTKIWRATNKEANISYTHLLFSCHDNIYVSSLRIADGLADCMDEADELTNKRERRLNQTNKDCNCHEIINIMHTSKNCTTCIRYFPKTKDERSETIGIWKRNCSLQSSEKSNMSKCIYDINNRYENRSLCYNWTGEHIEDCENFTCPHDMFKCPDHYCISLGYVCDAYWDCPQGYDEINCQNISHPGYFRCRNSSVFISIESICDEVPDCPDLDEEQFCVLKKLQCPTKCQA